MSLRTLAASQQCYKTQRYWDWESVLQRPNARSQHLPFGYLCAQKKHVRQFALGHQADNIRQQGNHTSSSSMRAFSAHLPPPSKSLRPSSHARSERTDFLTQPMPFEILQPDAPARTSSSSPEPNSPEHGQATDQLNERGNTQTTLWFGLALLEGSDNVQGRKVDNAL